MARRNKTALAVWDVMWRFCDLKPEQRLQCAEILAHEFGDLLEYAKMGPAERRLWGRNFKC